MDKINVNLTPSQREFVGTKVGPDGYASEADYLASLVGVAQRQDAGEKLRSQLQEGEASGEPILMTPEEWDKILQESKVEATSRSTKRRVPTQQFHVKRPPTSNPWHWLLLASMVPLLIWQLAQVRPPSTSPQDYASFEVVVVEDGVQIRNVGAQPLVRVEIEFVATFEGDAGTHGEYRGKRSFDRWEAGEVQQLSIVPPGGPMTVVSFRFTGKTLSFPSEPEFRLRCSYNLTGKSPD